MASKPNSFANIGGLDKQIQAVKEMVIFPRKYKSLQEKFGIKSPKGVLLHGPPGTGKTLLASALATELSTNGRRVTFISRKGADILNSYLGESEKRLRQVFEMARLNSPAVIFFDEIDALAPSRNSLCRSSHVYSSIVSVLLTEMDGINTAPGCDIFVIGATNRIDSIDAALRRPGRFDRELRFTLPTLEERRQIIKVHSRQWTPSLPEDLVEYLAGVTEGHCGADLQAICGETIMCCLRRTHPGVEESEEKMHIRKSRLKVTIDDIKLARAKFVPAAWRIEKSSARKLSDIVEPLFVDKVQAIASSVREKYPYEYLQESNTIQDKGKGRYLGRPRLLLTGSEEHGVTQHLAPAVMEKFPNLPVILIDLTTLFKDGSTCSNESCIKAIRNAMSTLPCILYMPDVASWWHVISESTRSLIASEIGAIPEDATLMLVATANETYEELPHELQRLFLGGLPVEVPSAAERERFFSPLLLKQTVNSSLERRRGKSGARSRSESSSSSSSSSSDTNTPAPPPPMPRTINCQRQRDMEERRKRAERRALGKSCWQPIVESRDSQENGNKCAHHGAGESDGRRAILKRLVNVTSGYPSLPLERAYIDLSFPFHRHDLHNDEERLLAELRDVVKTIEQQAQARAAKDSGFGGFS